MYLLGNWDGKFINLDSHHLILPCSLDTEDGLGLNVGLGRQDGIRLEWGLLERLIWLRLGSDPLPSRMCKCSTMINC